MQHSGFFRRTRRSSPRAAIAVVAMAMAVLATACERVAVTTFDHTSDHALSMRYLTSDGTDGYDTLVLPGSLQVRAPATNQGTNTRMLAYPPAQPMTDDHQSCATWSDQEGLNTQQGLALRVRHDVPEGRWRAITVTKNVMWGAHWQFNVLTWDTRHPHGWQVRGAVDLGGVFWPNDQLAPLPWRVCARVEGDVVRVKGWRAEQPEPSWDDPAHTGSVRLPIEWVYAGKAGWYVGHVPPGGSTTLTDLRLDRLEIRAD